MAFADLLKSAGGALATVAPTVARALGGPLAGLAVEAVTEAFGVERPEDVDLSSLSADQIVKLKRAEMRLQERMAELGIEEQQLDAQDRDSARRRQIEMKDWSVNVLAGAFVVGFFALITAMLSGEFSAEMVASPPFMMLLGALTAGLTQVMNYYFGSSRGSAKKTDALTGMAGNR